jgi:hypothetical protein
MADQQLVVVPVYWGQKWLPGDPKMQPLNRSDGIDWVKMNSAIWTVLTSWYMTGLQDYGVIPGFAHPGLVDADSSPPNPFEDAAAWDKLEEVISSGSVPAPDAWGDDHKVLYSLFMEPGAAYVDPNIFGRNDKDRVRVWVTANSDFPGVVETFAHELVECASHDEIADPCQPNTVEIRGLRLPKYHSKSLNTCWPTDEAMMAHRGLQVISHFDPNAKVNVATAGAGGGA